jgi:Flp pilus assembly protein TadG
MKTYLMRILRKEQGDAMVEFSIVAVLFMILLLSVVEMSRMVLVYTTMANAARAGARYAIVHGGDRTGTVGTYYGPSTPGNTTEVQTVAKNFASAGLVKVSNLTVNVTYPDGNNAAGSRVDVSVSYVYDPLLGYFSSILNKTLSSTSEGVITF